MKIKPYPLLRGDVSFTMADSTCLVRGHLPLFFRAKRLSSVPLPQTSAPPGSLMEGFAHRPARFHFQPRHAGAKSAVELMAQQATKSAGMEEGTCFKVAVRRGKAAFMSPKC